MRAEGKEVKIKLQQDKEAAGPAETVVTQLPDWDLLPPRGVVRRPKNDKNT